ncbi:unnamed protein product [Prunus armeniaca]
MGKDAATLGHTAAAQARRGAEGFSSFRWGFRRFRPPFSSIEKPPQFIAVAGGVWRLVGHC